MHALPGPHCGNPEADVGQALEEAALPQVSDLPRTPTYIVWGQGRMELHQGTQQADFLMVRPHPQPPEDLSLRLPVVRAAALGSTALDSDRTSAGAGGCGV